MTTTDPTAREVVTRPLTTPEGVTFTPWTDGVAVGYRVTFAQDDRVEWVILNPSTAQDDERAGHGDVFLYHGIGDVRPDDDPIQHADALLHVDVGDTVPWPQPDGYPPDTVPPF